MSVDSRIRKIEEKMGLSVENEDDVVFDLGDRTVRLRKADCDAFIRELNEEAKSRSRICPGH
jgi:hypothetical protein